MIMLPIYVINLERSPERLVYMQSQLKKLGLDFARIDAIDGSKIDAKLLKKYQQESKYSLLHYTSLNAGEIGCALSWQYTWDIVSKQNTEFCLVLEDDVELLSNFYVTLASLMDLEDENIVIDLSGKKGFNALERKSINGINLVRYQTPPLKNQAAIYSKGACKRFSEKISNFCAPVDTLRQMIWLHGVKTWSLETGCVSHQTQAVGGSTIQHKKLNLLGKLRRELLRPIWRLFINIRNFFTNA